MIGRTWRGLALVGVTVGLLGCPEKKAAPADAEAEAAPTASATVAAPAPEAANEGDIKRYPGVETKLDHLSATIAAYVATVRSDASSGASLVAVLKKGTDTQKLAQKDTFYLVTFNDPGTPGRKVMGWVDQKAFIAVIWDASKHFITCPAGQAAIVLDIGEQCITPCDPANDKCPGGQACNGDAPKSIQGSAGDNIEFCVVGVKKGGTTPPLPTVVDSGTTPPAVADAGAVVKSSRPPMLAKPDGGRCATGYDETKQRCQLHCATDADCNNIPGWHCSKQSSCSDLPGS